MSEPVGLENTMDASFLILGQHTATRNVKNPSPSSSKQAQDVTIYPVSPGVGSSGASKPSPPNIPTRHDSLTRVNRPKSAMRSISLDSPKKYENSGYLVNKPLDVPKDKPTQSVRFQENANNSSNNILVSAAAKHIQQKTNRSGDHNANVHKTQKPGYYPVLDAYLDANKNETPSGSPKLSVGTDSYQQRQPTVPIQGSPRQQQTPEGPPIPPRQYPQQISVPSNFKVGARLQDHNDVNRLSLALLQREMQSNFSKIQNASTANGVDRKASPLNASAPTSTNSVGKAPQLNVTTTRNDSVSDRGNATRTHVTESESVTNSKSNEKTDATPTYLRFHSLSDEENEVIQQNVKEHNDTTPKTIRKIEDHPDASRGAEKAGIHVAKSAYVVKSAYETSGISTENHQNNRDRACTTTNRQLRSSSTQDNGTRSESIYTGEDNKFLKIGARLFDYLDPNRFNAAFEQVTPPKNTKPDAPQIEKVNQQPEVVNKPTLIISSVESVNTNVSNNNNNNNNVSVSNPNDVPIENYHSNSSIHSTSYRSDTSGVPLTPDIVNGNEKRVMFLVGDPGTPEVDDTFEKIFEDHLAEHEFLDDTEVSQKYIPASSDFLYNDSGPNTAEETRNLADPTDVPPQDVNFPSDEGFDSYEAIMETILKEIKEINRYSMEVLQEDAVLLELARNYQEQQERASTVDNKTSLEVSERVVEGQEQLEAESITVQDDQSYQRTESTDEANYTSMPFTVKMTSMPFTVKMTSIEEQHWTLDDPIIEDKDEDTKIQVDHQVTAAQINTEYDAVEPHTVNNRPLHTGELNEVPDLPEEDIVQDLSPVEPETAQEVVASTYVQFYQDAPQVIQLTPMNWFSVTPHLQTIQETSSNRTSISAMSEDSCATVINLDEQELQQDATEEDYANMPEITNQEVVAQTSAAENTGEITFHGTSRTRQDVELYVQVATEVDSPELGHVTSDAIRQEYSQPHREIEERKGVKTAYSITEDIMYVPKSMQKVKHTGQEASDYGQIQNESNFDQTDDHIDGAKKSVDLTPKSQDTSIYKVVQQHNQEQKESQSPNAQYYLYSSTNSSELSQSPSQLSIQSPSPSRQLQDHDTPLKSQSNRFKPTSKAILEEHHHHMKPAIRPHGAGPSSISPTSPIGQRLHDYDDVNRLSFVFQQPPQQQHKLPHPVGERLSDYDDANRLSFVFQQTSTTQNQANINFKIQDNLNIGSIPELVEVKSAAAPQPSDVIHEEQNRSPVAPGNVQHPQPEISSQIDPTCKVEPQVEHHSQSSSSQTIENLQDEVDMHANLVAHDIVHQAQDEILGQHHSSTQNAEEAHQQEEISVQPYSTIQIPVQQHLQSETSSQRYSPGQAEEQVAQLSSPQHLQSEPIRHQSGTIISEELQIEYSPALAMKQQYPLVAPGEQLHKIVQQPDIPQEYSVHHQQENFEWPQPPPEAMTPHPDGEEITPELQQSQQSYTHSTVHEEHVQIKQQEPTVHEQHAQVRQWLQIQQPVAHQIINQPDPEHEVHKQMQQKSPSHLSKVHSERPVEELNQETEAFQVQKVVSPQPQPPKQKNITRQTQLNISQQQIKEDKKPLTTFQQQQHPKNTQAKQLPKQDQPQQNVPPHQNVPLQQETVVQQRAQQQEHKDAPLQNIPQQNASLQEEIVVQQHASKQLEHQITPNQRVSKQNASLQSIPPRQNISPILENTQNLSSRQEHTQNMSPSQTVHRKIKAQKQIADSYKASEADARNTSNTSLKSTKLFPLMPLRQKVGSRLSDYQDENRHSVVIQQDQARYFSV